MDFTPTVLRAIARTCHEVNRAYCRTIGDDSQPSWDDADDWQQQSAIAGVIAVLRDPDITPEQSHMHWMKRKMDEGWTFGAEKNVITKKHPAMLPYEMLPDDFKKKDLLFTSIVKGVHQSVAIIFPLQDTDAAQ